MSRSTSANSKASSSAPSKRSATPTDAVASHEQPSCIVDENNEPREETPRSTTDRAQPTSSSKPTPRSTPRDGGGKAGDKKSSGGRGAGSAPASSVAAESEKALHHHVNPQLEEDTRAARRVLEDPQASKALLSGESLVLYRELKEANARLVARLTELNSGLDQQLNKQQLQKRNGGTAPVSPDRRSHYATDDSPPPLTKADRLAAKNLELKREITNLNKALKEQQAGAGAIFELRNKAGALKKTLEEVVSENKSLENVYGNQNVKTSKFDRGEQQLNDIRREHNDQLRETKDLVKQFKDLREIEMNRTRSLLKTESQLQEKAKFLAQHGYSTTAAKKKADATGDNKDEGGAAALTASFVSACFPYLQEDAAAAAPFNPQRLHAFLSRLVLEEEELQRKIQSTAVQAVRERHRVRTQGPRLAQEADELREEIKLLREKEEVLRMAQNLDALDA